MLGFDEFLQPLVFLVCFVIMGFTLIKRNRLEIQNDADSSPQNQQNSETDQISTEESRSRLFLNRIKGGPMKKIEKQMKNSLEKIQELDNQLKHFEEKIQIKASGQPSTSDKKSPEIPDPNPSIVKPETENEENSSSDQN